MAGVVACPFLISLLTVTTVFGCAPMLQGQERMLNFSVTGFTLPVAMVYTENAGIRAQLPTISHSVQAAQSFVTTLVMQSVTNVLEREGRNAGLLQFVIDLILQQLTVQINYTPMNCAVAFINPTGQSAIQMNMMENCIVIGSTVSAICRAMAANQMCMPGAAANLFAVPAEHLLISGRLTIANLIMAGWSQQMWQTILNRVIQDMRAGPYGMNFISATVTIVQN